MSQATVFDFELPVVFNGYNSVSYGFNPGRSYSWDISMNPTVRGFYGYGYGISFYDLESVGALDYFHVIGVTGTSTGYGISSTKGDTIDEFNFGWGYEFAPAIISDNNDSLTVVATVTENGIPISNIRVIFIGSVGTTLSVNAGFTDENGQIETVVTIDNTKELMRMLDSNDSLSTIFDLKSTISNTTMIGDSEQNNNNWIVYLPVGRTPEQFYLPSDATNELENIRITVTDAQQEYISDKVKPTSLFEIPDQNRWALSFESSVNYPFNDLGDSIEAIPVSPTTLEIFTVSNGNKKFEKLPINGWLNVRAYIDEKPQENEKKIVVNIGGSQDSYEQSVFNLVFNSYAFQTYRNYSYPA